MEIRSIRIDLDKDILEINGEPVKRKTLVSLPALDGFYFQKLFNFNENKPKEKCDSIKVDYMESGFAYRSH